MAVWYGTGSCPLCWLVGWLAIWLFDFVTPPVAPVYWHCCLEQPKIVLTVPAIVGLMTFDRRWTIVRIKIDWQECRGCVIMVNSLVFFLGGGRWSAVMGLFCQWVGVEVTV
ncbi:hypothetical protein HOY82DRAFT_218543 [Tuber indicum]|nr:hypothetical protein HOY82DRAFT_218543 [Tuber indicum]